MGRHHHGVDLGHRGFGLGGRCGSGGSGGLGVCHRCLCVCHRRLYVRHHGSLVCHRGLGVCHGRVGRSLRGGQLRFESGDLLGRGGRQSDTADSGNLQPVAADVLQFAGVAHASHLDVGDDELVGREHREFGQTEADRVGNQLPARLENRLDGSGRAPLVLEQGGVHGAVVPNRRDVNRIPAGERCLRLIQVKQADVEHVGRDHHLGGMVGRHHHGIDLGHRLVLGGARPGGVLLGDSGIGQRLLGVGLGGRGLGSRLRRVSLRCAHRRVGGGLRFAQGGFGCLRGGHRLVGFALDRIQVGLGDRFFVAGAGGAQRSARCSNDCACRY